MPPTTTVLTKDLQSRWVMATNTVLILGLAALTAVLTWRLMPVNITYTDSSPGNIAVKTTTKISANTQTQAALIEKAILFGVVDNTPPPAPLPKIAPTTPLNLTLKGIFASSGDPRVIISGSNNTDNVYAIGNMLPGNAKLTAIHADRVVLLRNGTEEILYLPKEQINTESTLSTPSNYLAQRQASSQSHEQRPDIRRHRSSRPARPNTSSFNNSPSLPRHASTSQPTATASTDASELKEAFMNDPASLMKYGRVSPARQGGRQIGYRIYEGQMQGQLARYGIQAGDIITSVNNIQLNGSQSIGKLMNIVSQSAHVRVELLRNGSPMTKNFQLR